MNEAHYYHAVSIAAHSGYATMKRYHIAGGGSWEGAYHAFRKDVAQRDNAMLIRETATPFPDPREAYERMERLGIRLALTGQKEFPEALRHIPYPPFALYIRGGAIPQITTTISADTTTLAIVGTRRASMEGKKTARYFARELAAAGCAIASGLAFGIDAAAHEGALDAGGITIAVLAGGLDAVSPYSHRALAEKILEHGGALISEYPPGEAPLAYRFIERNRIMSGISRGALIVEAPESSGALATARYAVEQNREVFVVPGAVSASNFRGSHTLIRQGAELVTSPDDILNEYDIHKKTIVAAHDAASSPEETLILKVLAQISAPADVDKIITMTRLEPRVVNQTLSFLAIRGIIKESGGGYTI